MFPRRPSAVRAVVLALLAGAASVATASYVGTPASAAARSADATFVVTSTADLVDARVGDGACRTDSGACTLRAAVMEAAVQVGRRSEIVVPAGRYELTRRPALAPVDLTAARNGSLDLLWPVTIRGAGARRTVIDANSLDRIFTVVTPGTDVTIQDMTLTGGVAVQRELLVVTGGGAIANQGNLTLRRVTIRGNRADYGGGVFNTPSATARIYRSSIIGNTANLEAGGVRFDAAGTVMNSTIARNRVLGSCCPPALSYPGSNVGEGGGVDARGVGPVFLVNSTIVENHAVTGGGGVNIATGYQGSLGGLLDFLELGGRLFLRNTIVARNTSDAGPANCASTLAPIVSRGGNLADDRSCPLTATGDRSATDPALLALGDHGGPTNTYLPAATSPALGGAISCPATDQRGVRRPSGGCDIGAVELP